MSLYACVLAKIKTGLAIEAVEQLISHKAVGLALPTAGPFDLFMLVKTDSPAALGRLIVEELQVVDGVESTLTLFIMDEVRALNWLHDLLNESVASK